MQLKRINSAIDRVGRNDINENFGILERTYGKTAIDAETAKEQSLLANEIAETAVETSDEAKRKAESVQEQFNQVVIEGDSSIEAAQARVSVNDTVYTTLKERLDVENAQITQRLAQNTDRLNAVNNHANADSALNLINYLGNNQNIHSKVLDMTALTGAPWNGYRYWMAYTPYPYGVTTHENPCIAVSDDKINWTTPAGLVNPLASQPTDGYNSDTHLVYRADANTLEIWYRPFIATTSKASLYRRTSTDGVNWTSAELVLDATNSEQDVLSPAVHFESGQYIMYGVVNATGKIIKTTSNAPSSKVWTAYEEVEADWGTVTPWHLDVIKTDLGTEFLVQAYDVGKGNNTSDLWHFVLQTNGHTTKPIKVLSPNPEGVFDSMGIYRSTFIKDSDGTYHIWYSGVAKDWKRGLGYTCGTNIAALNGYRTKIDKSDDASIKAMNAVMQKDYKQVVEYADLSAQWRWTGVSGSIAVANNELTYTVTTPSTSARIENNDVSKVIIGHKYFIGLRIFAKYDTSTRLTIGKPNSDGITSHSITPNEYTLIGNVIEATTNDRLRIYHSTSTNYNIGDTIKCKDLFIIDLTSTFGVGNEPSVDVMLQVMQFYKKEFLYGLTISEIQNYVSEWSTLKIATQFDAIGKASQYDYKQAVNVTAGWVGVDSSVALSDGVITQTTNALSIAHRVENGDVAKIVAGHKYFISADVLAKYANVTYFSIGGSSTTDAQSPFYPKANEWTTGCSVHTAINSERFRIYHRTNANYAIGDTVKYRNIFVIDLTAIFGAGNEPNSEVMCEVLKYYRKEFMYQSTISEMQTDIATLKSAVVALGGTI